MTSNKTAENDADPAAFLAAAEPARRAEDARRVAKMMAEVTGEPPRMWGDSIVGFGRYRYTRADGSKHHWMLTGVSPRKAALTVYIMPGFKLYGDLLARLGPHRHSSSCLYITRLDQVDFDVLTELVRRSVGEMRARYPG